MGRYRPPDSDPRTQSFNSHTGTHPLGKRASKLSTQGILVVRFELPYNIWCEGCHAMLAQGTRYNAEKKKVGMYHSTPIWSFRCKCSSHSGCTNHFEIETDPKNTRYVVVSGARRKEEEWERDEEEDGNQYSMAGKMIDLDVKDVLAKGRRKVGRDGEIRGDETQDLQKDDAFSALDKQTSQRSLQEQRERRILELEEAANKRSADPYLLNSKLRSTFREEKRIEIKKRIAEAEAKEAMGWGPERKLIMPGTEEEEQRKQDDHQAWLAEQDRRQKERVGKGERHSPLPTTGGSKARASSTACQPNKKPRVERSSRPDGRASKRHRGPPKRHRKASAAPAATSSRPLNAAASRLAATLVARTRKNGDPFGT